MNAKADFEAHCCILCLQVLEFLHLLLYTRLRGFLLNVNALDYTSIFAVNNNLVCWHIAVSC